MAGKGEALNVLVSLTIIWAFCSVCIDFDALNQIFNEILSFGAAAVGIVLLVLLLLQSQNDSFLRFSRQLHHRLVQNFGISQPLNIRRRHCGCHCHTISEATRGFMIQKLKHELVKRIRDGVYQVNVQNIGAVIYTVAQQIDSASRESYNLAIACSNEFILKGLYNFYPDCNQVYYVMEHYEQNFQQWLQENPLFDGQGINLNPEFLQILRDVLRGIGYLHHVKKRCHGNLSVWNIVTVNGRAKITGMVNAVPETNIDDGRDYLDLATIITRCFEDKQEAIPTELRLFLIYISTTKPSRLLNVENHPIFLSPLQRLSYRMIAHTFLYFGNAKKPFSLALKRRLCGHKWKHNVGKFRVVFNRHKCLQSLQRKKFKYSQSAMSFLRFGRNVVAHLKDNFGREPGTEILTAEEVEEELNGYWPEFMPVLHQVLVEHGHLILVHDAVLK